MSGLTETGLEIKTIEEIIAGFEALQLTNIDPDLDTSATSVIGQLNAIYAAGLYEVWELLLALYQAAYPDTATGQQLAYLAALTGTIKKPAQKATIYVSLTGDATTVIPAGTRVSVQDDANSVFELITEYTLTGVPATDTVLFRAVEAGSSTQATVGEAVVIEDSITNWDSGVFAAPYTLGTDEETDTALRERREAELFTAGTGTVEAIKSDLLELDAAITSVSVFENVTSTTDANGLPPYSIECLVEEDGTVGAAAILQQIWISKPAGTATYGATSGTVTDTSGNNHTLYYSEPLQITVSVALDLEKDPTEYPGDSEVQDAISTWAESTLQIGDNVNAAAVVDVVMSTVAGVKNIDLTTVKCERGTGAPSTPNEVISTREKALIINANITVTSTDYVV